MRQRIPSALLLFSLLLPSPLLAQDEKDPPKESKESSKETRTIYIPFDKLEQVFEHNDRAVYMSYKEFLKLLEKAQGNKPPVTQKPKTPKPPADWVLVSSQYEGQLSDKVARFKATFNVEVLKQKGWVSIPLAIDGIAFSNLKAHNKEAIVVRDTNSYSQGYRLLVEESGALKLEADFVVPINDKTPGERSFTFRLPEAAISSFKVRLPEKGLKVEVSPSLSVATEDSGEQTLVTAYLSRGGAITVKWWPRPKEVKGQKALLYADTTTLMRLEEGVVRTSTKIHYRIHQSSAQSFEVGFPKEYKILSVTGKNIERWDPLSEGSGLSVKLRSPVERAYDLNFKLERIVPDVTAELRFPEIRTLNTEREVGTAVVVGSKLLRLKVGASDGVTQITKNLDQLPRDLISDLDRSRYGAPLAFHTKGRFKLGVKATRVEPEITGHVTTLAVVRDGEISVRTRVYYTVKRRGIFSVKLELPKGFNLLECGDERSVKDYRISGQTLEVDIPYQVLARPYELVITGQLSRDKDLKGFSFPVFKLLGVKKETGNLAVAAVKHLELTTEKSKGLIAVNPNTLLQKGLVSRHGGSARGRQKLHVDNSKEDLTLAFKYARPGGQAEIGVKKRNPKIDARVSVLANAEEDLLKVEGTVNYKIQYAGVDVFKLLVPEALVKAFKIKGEGIKEKSPKKSDKGGSVFTVKTQSKQLNQYKLKFSYEIKFEDLKPGAETEVALEPVRVLEVDNERGDLALIKHENLVIREVPGSRRSLEIRDISELPQELKQAKVFRAYRYLGTGYALKLRIIKYDFKAPLGTLVKHLHLDEVVTKEGTIQTEAWMLLQNSTEQFLRVQLPKQAVVKGLRVAGNWQKWSEAHTEGGQNEILVNLASHSGKTEPFLVRLRYDVASSGSALATRGEIQLVTPRFPLRADQVPVARFTRQLVFGPAVATLDFETDMTRHFDAEPGLWKNLKSFVFTPMGRHKRVNEVMSSIVSLKQRDRARRGSTGLYAELKNAALVRPGYSPRGAALEKTRLFSKLNGAAELKVGYISWSLHTTFEV